MVIEFFSHCAFKRGKGGFNVGSETTAEPFRILFADPWL